MFGSSKLWFGKYNERNYRNRVENSKEDKID